MNRHLLPLIAAVLIASCAPAPVQRAANTVPSSRDGTLVTESGRAVLHGRFVDPRATRASEIVLVLSRPVSSPDEQPRYSFSSTTEVAPDGLFTLPLPDVPSSQLAPLRKTPPFANCSGMLDMSDPGAALNTPVILVNALEGPNRNTLLLSDSPPAAQPAPGGQMVEFWYADRRTTVRGQLSCTAPSMVTTRNFALDVTAGWNVITVNRTLDGHLLYATETPLVPGLVWVARR